MYLYYRSLRKKPGSGLTIPSWFSTTFEQTAKNIYCLLYPTLSLQIMACYPLICDHTAFRKIFR